MTTKSPRPADAQHKGLLLMLGAGGLTAAIAVAAPGLGLPSTNSSSITNSPKEVIDQVWQIVYRDFLDSSGKYSPETWTSLRRDLLAKSYAGTNESYEAIRGMLASLDDPYTRFLDPKEFKEMQIDTSGELTGVGIQITLDKDTKEILVVSPIEGTPASRAGVQPKDVIVSIDGNPTKGMITLYTPHLAWEAAQDQEDNDFTVPSCMSGSAELGNYFTNEYEGTYSNWENMFLTMMPHEVHRGSFRLYL